jgi:hypothetical protein
LRIWSFLHLNKTPLQKILIEHFFLSPYCSATKLTQRHRVGTGAALETPRLAKSRSSTEYSLMVFGLRDHSIDEKELKSAQGSVIRWREAFAWMNAISETIMHALDVLAFGFNPTSPPISQNIH